MTRSLKTLALAAALVLGAAAPAVFAMPHGGSHGRGGHALMEMLDNVDATDAQRQQIRQIMKAAHEELRPLHEQMRGLRQEQMKLWGAANLDAAALEALRKQGAGLHEQVAARMSRALIDAGRVLSPEQRAKMSQRAAKRMERMHERMKDHGARG